jgi:hypothetical protein
MEVRVAASAVGSKGIEADSALQQYARQKKLNYKSIG